MRMAADSSSGEALTEAAQDGSGLPLASRVAIVTGGGSSIGLACARLLVRDGANVVIVGRDEEKLAQARKELLATAPFEDHVHLMRADITVESEIEAVVRYAQGLPGGVRIAIASAGGSIPTPLLD